MINHKKSVFWVVVLSISACVIIAVCLLTYPKGFQFDEASHTIVSANHLEIRTADDTVSAEMNSSQISELSSRLAGIKKTKKSDEYSGCTPVYQINALLEDGTCIHINGYDLSDNDVVDIEWNDERYVISDVEFQDYLSRICSRADVSSADNNMILDYFENIESDDTGIIEDNKILSEDIVSEEIPFVPTETDVLELRAIVLAGMSDSEIIRLTDFIKAANLSFENAWFNNDIFGQLSDPENVYWTYFDRTGEIQIGWAESSDGKISAVIDYNDYDAAFFISTISELKESVVSGMLDDDMDKLIDLCSKAQKTHDVKYVVDMYHTLHDMDYFLLRYGPADVGEYVKDDSTISKYYGSLSIWMSYNHATEPAQVTSPETAAAPQLQDWKRAYLEFLEGVNDYHVGFALVYIDGDDIPELYLNGDCEATGDAVCTYKNGKVLEERLGRIWGGSYIPGAGLVKNTNGNMGYYTTDIYSLTANGFTVIWNGLETQEVIPPANENEEPTMIISFSIGDQTVSEEEYHAAIEAVFNTSQAVLLHENTLSYDAVRQLILDS